MVLHWHVLHNHVYIGVVFCWPSMSIPLLREHQLFCNYNYVLALWNGDVVCCVLRHDIDIKRQDSSDEYAETCR
jgi:hypothetical protein